MARNQENEISEKEPEAAGLPESKAFRRNVRRHVEAPTHRFAAITAPEMAGLCQEELRSLGFSGTEITEAGVEFSGDFSYLYLANLWLRTAGRVLCRLPSFRAGIAEELFYKASGHHWELWLNPGIPLQVTAHVEHSRIENEGVVADTVLTAVRKRFKARGLAPPAKWEPESGGEMDKDEEEQASDEGETSPAVLSHKQRMIVHLRKNHCEISLDTTGAHLHLRGYRLHHTGAPLRETLAAAILMKSGWRGDSPLVDGMCGSGTIPIEAALMARRLPLGLRRPFLFQHWPAFGEKTWLYHCRKARESALDHSPVPIFALDHDPGAIQVAHDNAGRAGVEGDIHQECKDFFDFRPQDYGLAPGLLILNPPYGKRLGGGGKELYERLGAHLHASFGKWRVAILAPNRAMAMSLKIGSMRLWTVGHGGTPVLVVMGRL